MRRLQFGLLVAGLVGAAWVGSALAIGQAAPQAQGQGRAGGAGADAAARPTGSGLVVGQVVDATTGRPVAGAVVTMTVRPTRGGGPGARGNPAAAAGAGPAAGPNAGPSVDRELSDNEGRFVYHDLPGGTVVLTATAYGYANGSLGQTRPNGPARPLDLGDGERVTDARIMLWKYGVIAGTVLDDGGEPAIGVTVRAMRKTTAGGRPGYSSGGQGKTDDRGIYRISQLLPGDYVVAIPQTQTTLPAAVMESMVKGVASGAGVGAGFMDIMSSGGPIPDGRGMRVGDYVTSSTSGASTLAPTSDGRVLAYQTLYYPTAAAPAQATVVPLKSGEERTGLNFQLRIVATARVAGVVTGPDGPAGNIGVRLLPTNADELSGETGFETATTATKVDGSFVFLGVPPGQYVAKVVKQPRPQLPPELANSGLMSLAFGSGMNAAPTGMAALALYAQAAVTVSGADVTSVALTLTEGSKLSGRIVFEGSAPPAPQAMTQISLVLTSADGRNPSQGPRPGQPMTDQTGAFKTLGFPAGKYFVQVSGAVPPGWMMKSVVAAGRDALTQPLELKDADINDVVITLTDHISQVTGTAHAAGLGTPPPATVILFPSNFATWAATGMAPRLTRSAVAAPKTGAFTLPNVLAGDYLVAALDDRDVAENADAAYFTALARVATKVSVGDGEKKAIDLPIVRIR